MWKLCALLPAFYWPEPAFPSCPVALAAACTYFSEPSLSQLPWAVLMATPGTRPPPNPLPLFFPFRAVIPFLSYSCVYLMVWTWIIRDFILRDL